MKLQPLFSYQAAVNREKRVAKTKQNSEALPVPTALNTALNKVERRGRKAPKDKFSQNKTKK